MSKQVINTGNTANDGTGDTLRGAALKINSNFTELYSSAQSAFSKANSGYELANAAYAYANASAVLITQELSSNVEFIAAINSSQNTTISTVTALTTNAYNKANNSGDFANAAFGVANTVNSTGAIAFNTANNAFDKANVAYTIANNALNVRTGGTVSGDISLGTNQLKFGSGDVYEYSDSLLLNPHQNKALSIKTSILDGFDEVVYGWTFGANGKLIFPDNTSQTTAFTTGISNTITATGVYANGAFSAANDAYSLANSAFTYANTLISDTMVDPWARQQANDAFDAANTANTLAQSAFDYANTIISDTQIDSIARDIANGAFDAANTNANNITLVGSYANSAFTKANTTPTSLSNGSYSFGMTDAGYVNLKYNNTTYAMLYDGGLTSYSQMVLESANNVSGNNSAVLFDRNGSGIVFRLEDSTPVSLNWGFYQTNVLFPDGTRQYTAANNTLAQAAFDAANSAMTPSSLSDNTQTLSLSANTLTYSSANLQIINNTNSAINFSQSGVSVTASGIDEQENDISAAWQFYANGSVLLPAETTFNSHSGTVSMGTTDLSASSLKGSFIEFYDTSVNDAWFNASARDNNGHTASIYGGANSATGLLYTQISTYDGGAVYGQKDWTFHKSGKTEFPIVTAPATSVGESGDEAGMVAFTQDHMYFCVGQYDGNSDIWKRIAWPSETW